MNRNIWEGIVNSLDLPNLSFPSVRITDLIDIALVAIVIYIVLIWIKNTRAWSLFRGLAIILAISLIAYKFHFYTLTWLIERTFSVGIIALVILFQPELRKALEQLGTGGWAGVFSGIADVLNVENNTRLNYTSVNNIVEACAKMARERTGALILIERNVPAGDFIKTGIAIDAVISSQLLVNIFVDKTPLHDAAVVIQNNRIAAACCILPVTQTDLKKELGTRHRAAVGASEQSDAYIIIVSEETGAISVANEGRLMENLSERELSNILNSLVEGKNLNTIFFRGKGKGKGKKK
ncbi:MAG: diadenylate cyclase CdaA [Firmicutes bacterium]|nr:diadenylate cyclase CdaA [Bacillota bacterium]